ncbi:multidrug effflux MFS transporter [Pyxidicoccus fallax]|uniref:Multidrug effflux MFS transporter n=1 Tax=Pyxidicoccus fallax TaxID=394095 RepID=A0A848LP02_9BACT|nr:multidrug effflux MFS transporter [Pyxidicoccus fallax]NMO19382.1 multidrug effflux MFS transporter [Pyxidicoccus fallax]NPC80232.1 multidrug effflux MFS transporter [Pyxidicoccus fallax]
MSTASKESTPRGTLALELLLGTLTAFAPLSIDMYLPALPGIAEDLRSSASVIQLTLASCFAGLALGQLITGPLIDHFGRKRPLQLGLGLYVLGSLGCALAPNAPALVALRFVQALGGAVALVTPRAVVRDLWSGAEAARTMSRLMLVVGVAPVLAPLLGGFVLRHSGWRTIFVVLAVVGALALVAVVRTLRETAPPRTGTRTMRSRLGELLGDADFVGPALAGGFAYAGMFAYIAGSPFVFISLHGVAPENFGWFFGANAVGLVTLAQLNRKLVRHIPLHRLLRIAVSLYAVTAVGVLLVAWSGFLGLWGLAAALFLFVSTLGLVGPNSAAIALERHAAHAGLASALLGALQFASAAAASWAVSTFNNGTAKPMGGVVAVAAALAWLAGVVGHRTRSREQGAGEGSAVSRGTA